MPGLYIHIPFCAQRCVYCDFYFVTTKKSAASYIQALRKEITIYAEKYGKQEPVETIYFGGGTPSRLHPDEVFSVLSTIEQSFDVHAREIAFEVNPEDVDKDYLRSLRAMGVTRLSIGVQSFFDSDLTFMNRSHNAQRSVSVIEEVRGAGFDNFSIDLIFGLPGQPLEYWGANLEKAVELGVPHVATYGLTVETNTPLYKSIQSGKVDATSDDDMADLFLFTMDYLEERGYHQYEVSSFARPGYRSQHNQNYWNHTNYLGFGPSAHSFWRRGSSGQRWANIRNIKRYEGLLEGRTLPIEERDHVDLDTLANEYILLRLRTADGLDLDVLETDYGVDLYHERIDDLAWLESEGYILPVRNSRIQLSRSGMALCDMVTSKLVLG